MPQDPRLFGYTGYRVGLTGKEQLSTNSQYQTSFIHNFIDDTDFKLRAKAIIVAPITLLLIEVVLPFYALSVFLTFLAWCLCFNATEAKESAKGFGIAMIAMVSIPFALAVSPIVEIFHVLLSSSLGPRLANVINPQQETEDQDIVVGLN